MTSAAVTASLSESYRGTLAAGSVVQSVAAIGLFTGPLITAIAYNAGGGLHLSYVPILLFVLITLALCPLLAERAPSDQTRPGDDIPLRAHAVAAAMRFALPLIFISMTGLALYLSLVPAYLASALRVVNPALGAGAVVAAQLASLVATLRIKGHSPQRTGLIAAIVSVVGLTLLVLGTSANAWPLIGVATLMVGAGCGVGAAAALSIAGRVGRGQKARIFARLYVSAYAGYSIPALVVGIIASHASFTTAFVTIILVLAAITAILPLLAESSATQTSLEGSAA
jgi:hypothetical protein